MMARGVLSIAPEPLPSNQFQLPASVTWTQLFPETRDPRSALSVVLVWSSWSAHGVQALEALREASARFSGAGWDVRVFTALDISTKPSDAERQRAEARIRLPEIEMAPGRFAETEGPNQMPALLLFHDGVLVDDRLGAQSADSLVRWIGSHFGGMAQGGQ